MPAAAQTPPPRHDTKSPTGVSFRSLTFSYDEEDLSIGGSGHEGLSFRRSYSSNPPPRTGMFFGLGWTDNFATYINNGEVPLPPASSHRLPTSANGCTMSALA
ncbi:DUF6531 domain-containing protein [Sphingomonas sp. 7/4-4]|uniref:DUF6531 domain-containing protein n=1 Tax=Sphingomonas sp. 7/4-4 TaxID=3018446 RepID=UPI003FA7EA10